jgi:peroxiredoxin
MRGRFDLLLILLLFCMCTGNRDNFKVAVTVNGSDGKYLYLARLTLKGSVVVDSTMPHKSGTYFVKGFTDEPDFFIIYKKPGEYINLIIHPGDDFRVITEEAAFDDQYLVEGSSDSRLIKKMVDQQRKTLEQITEISTEFENSQGSTDFVKIKSRIDSTYEKVLQAHRRFSIQLIEENQESLVSLMALYQQLGKNTSVFNYKNDFHYYALVDSNLSALYPNSEAVIDLNQKVTGLRQIIKLEPGSPAPEISMPDPNGNIISLSSLHGKYILLIFWASWSEQSLTELARFVDLYPKLSRNGLEYFLVSLDRTRESWLSGIDKTKASGILVSDLKYWDSPVVDIYRIENLPVTYLLNKEGLILKKNINAEELSTILKEELMEEKDR